MSIGMEGCGPNQRLYSQAEYDALRAENERLQAEKESLSKSLEQAFSNYNKVSHASTGRGEQIAQLRAELEAMRAENARLRADHGVVAHANLLRAQKAEAELEALRSQHAERQEAVAWKVVGVHDKHSHPHVTVEHTLKLAEGQAAHWRNRGCTAEVIPLYTSPPPAHTVRRRPSGEYECQGCGAVWDADEGRDCPNE